MGQKRETFLFSRTARLFWRGALLPKNRKEILELILLQCCDIAKKKKASFISFPAFCRDERQGHFFWIWVLEGSNAFFSLRGTWKLEIYPPEEELLRKYA